MGLTSDKIPSNSKRVKRVDLLKDTGLSHPGQGRECRGGAGWSWTRTSAPKGLSRPRLWPACSMPLSRPLCLLESACPLCCPASGSWGWGVGVGVPSVVTNSHLIGWTLECQLSRLVQSAFASGREGAFLVISGLAPVRMGRGPRSVQG